MLRVRHLKKGDTVVALSGSFKGKTGKVLEVKQSKGLVKVEGIGTAKKHQKPNQKNPKGDIVDLQRWLPAGKFQVASSSGKGLGRAGFVVKDSKKERVYSTQRK